jgi:hypothetical protein
MKSDLTLHDTELDEARMEVQALAETVIRFLFTVIRSLFVVYQLIESAQQRVNYQKAAAASRSQREAA